MFAVRQRLSGTPAGYQSYHRCPSPPLCHERLNAIQHIGSIRRIQSSQKGWRRHQEITSISFFIQMLTIDEHIFDKHATLHLACELTEMFSLGCKVPPSAGGFLLASTDLSTTLSIRMHPPDTYSSPMVLPTDTYSSQAVHQRTCAVQPASSTLKMDAIHDENSITILLVAPLFHKEKVFSIYSY